MDASSTSLLSSKRRELLALDTQKKSLESEAEAIVAELTAELPDGVSGNGLVFFLAMMMFALQLDSHAGSTDRNQHSPRRRGRLPQSRH